MAEIPNNQEGRVKKRRGRPRPLPPHVNARNLATEKRRREELNEDLVNLARLLPGLANARRLSKVSIIQESVRHLRQQRDMCLAAAQEMEEVIAENSRLVAQLNALSATGWGSLLPNATQRPVTEPMLRLMAVKDEVYGTFPAGFGDNWAHNSSPSSTDINGATEPISAATGSAPDQLSTLSSQSGHIGLAPAPTVIHREGLPMAYTPDAGAYAESGSAANGGNQTGLQDVLQPMNMVAPTGVLMEGSTWMDILDNSVGPLDMVLQNDLIDAFASGFNIPLGDYPHTLGTGIS
ncbi:basic helix-loop-helix domain-containing protein [Aspergillus stella-maris]|uniref:basic helix-loop-helix domain-containing protein n=1 Tax=Aspergillus stella-maris TaxID=1810926 RepID=UPI003CCCE289